MPLLIRRPPCTNCGGMVLTDLFGDSTCIACARTPVDPEAVVLDIPSPAASNHGGGARVRGMKL